MSEDRNVLARWSRLKRDAGKDKEVHSGERASAGERVAESPSAEQQAQPAEPEEAFDISSLPPIESISAGTDIRDFLRAGVPGELTKAALRRAWSADPAIRDFIGIAENQWDFTDPTAIPGFGPLQPADTAHELVVQAIEKLKDGGTRSPEGETSTALSGQSPGAEATAQADVRPEPQPHSVGEPEASDQLDEARELAVELRTDDVATQHEERAAELKRRLHGGALPKPA